MKQRRGGSCRSLPGFLPILFCFAALFALGGCGGGGGGNGGGQSASPAVAFDASPSAPATPQPSPTPTGDPSEVTDYTPNYVPNLAATRRWDRSVVTVGIAPASSPVSIAGATADPSALVQQAIDLWSHKVGQDIQFQVVSGSVDTAAPDVTVRWVAASALPNDAVGRTEVQYRNDDQVLVAAQIAVSESLPDSFKVQVVAHELGHALGIDGHSADSSDLMYANAHLPAVVTPSDQNTILWSYEVGPTRAARRSSGGNGSGIGTVVTVCGADL